MNMSTAIYLVILEQRQPYPPQWFTVWDVIMDQREPRPPQWFTVWDVIASIPCFLETVQPLWIEHVNPLAEAGRRIQALYIAREPYPNPFQEKAAEE
jgi:hypothetical protein